jgi:hypothetical protein
MSILKNMFDENLKKQKEILFINSMIENYLHENKDIDFIEEIHNGKLFFSLISFKTAQYKAPAFERFLQKKLKWEKISASEDKGDFIISEAYVELKTSFTNEAMCLNLRQIRLWQNIDYYLCFFIDDKNLFKKNIAFKLTKDQMKEEVSIMGGFTHGTKEANALNENSEYSITLRIKEDNEHFKRWKEKYLETNILKEVMED